MRKTNRRAVATGPAHQRTFIRRIEQLESRCMLSARPFDAPMGPLPAANGFGDGRYAPNAFDHQRGPGGQGDFMEGAADHFRNAPSEGFGGPLQQRSAQSVAPQMLGYDANSVGASNDGWVNGPVSGSYTMIIVEMIPSVPAVGNVANHLSATIGGPKPYSSNLGLAANIALNALNFTASSSLSSETQLAQSLIASTAHVGVGSGNTNIALRSTADAAGAITPKQDSALVTRAKSSAENPIDSSLAVAATGTLVGNAKAPHVVERNQDAAGTRDEATITSSASVQSTSPVKTALAGAALDIAKVEQAIEKVMKQVGQIGSDVTNWLDEAHLTPLAVAVSAAVAGAGTAYYLRRRNGKLVENREDEALSSWHFARLQPVPKGR